MIFLLPTNFIPVAANYNTVALYFVSVANLLVTVDASSINVAANFKPFFVDHNHLQLIHHSQCPYINTSPPLTTLSNHPNSSPQHPFELNLKKRSGHVQRRNHSPKNRHRHTLSTTPPTRQISLPIQVYFSLAEFPKESCSSGRKIFSSKLTDFNCESSIAWVRILGFPSTKTLCYVPHEPV